MGPNVRNLKGCNQISSNALKVCEPLILLALLLKCVDLLAHQVVDFVDVSIFHVGLSFGGPELLLRIKFPAPGQVLQRRWWLRELIASR